MHAMDEQMLTVLEVKIKRGQLCELSLSDGTQVDVDRRTWEQSPYRANSTLTGEDLSALLSLSAQNRARERALWLLSRRDYSKKELTGKLCRAADRDTAAEMAERMEEIGLLDDERYAERLAREYCFVRGYPARRAMSKMYEKGIARQQAEEAIQKIEADDMQAALAFLRKKCYTAKKGDATKNYEHRRKVYEAMLRFGFDYETARAAIRHIEEETEQ